MTDDKWLFISSKLLEMQKQSDRLNVATEGLLIAPESPLLDVSAKICDLLICSLNFIADDFFDTINWFVYECDYGRDAKEAGNNDEMRKIKNTDDLRWLIELEA